MPGRGATWRNAASGNTSAITLVLRDSDEAREEDVMAFGLEVGTRIPEFQARDQHGTLQTFQSLRGPRGLVIVFIRSADW